MSYPLRLPPELDAEAREQCARLGISLNAFIAVALDAYLRGTGIKVRRSPTAKQGGKRARPGAAAGAPAASPAKAGTGEPWLPDPDDWRVFHGDPDMWPYVDPDFEKDPIWDRIGSRVEAGDTAAMAELEAEYWRTRERPAGR